MGLFVGYWMGLSVGDLDEEFGLTDDFSVGLAVGFGVGLSDKKLVDHMVGTCVGLEVLSGKKIAEVQVSALNLPRFFEIFIHINFSESCCIKGKRNDVFWINISIRRDVTEKNRECYI
mmetsp:Transcript_13637/g.27790  ORF Transcript_13637/g.27790 Transcript_13637/m.27790 type:complete len:118 (-) Transcript_13637:652-1005(-)